MININDYYKLSKKTTHTGIIKKETKIKHSYFIIKYGPPASGKNFIVSDLQERLSIRTYIDIDVDSYVKHLVTESMKDTINDVIDQQTYWSFRKQADTISDAVLHNALEKGDHIMWETTGNSVEWTIDNVIPLVRKHQYQIVLAFPFSTLTTMQKRCKSRAQAAICTKRYLGNIKSNSDENFVKLYEYCDYVYIYFNDDDELKLIFEKNGDASSVVCEDDYISKLSNATTTRRHIRKVCAEKKHINRVKATIV